MLVAAPPEPPVPPPASVPPPAPPVPPPASGVAGVKHAVDVPVNGPVGPAASVPADAPAPWEPPFPQLTVSAGMDAAPSAARPAIRAARFLRKTDGEVMVPLSRRIVSPGGAS